MDRYPECKELFCELWAHVVTRIIIHVSELIHKSFTIISTIYRMKFRTLFTSYSAFDLAMNL